MSFTQLIYNLFFISGSNLKEVSNTESCLECCGVKARNRKELNILCSLFVNQKYCFVTNRIHSFETEETSLAQCCYGIF